MRKVLNTYWGARPYTVRFPASGFYPFELDYAEDGNLYSNRLSLSLPTGDLVPISGGP